MRLWKNWCTPKLTVVEVFKHRGIQINSMWNIATDKRPKHQTEEVNNGQCILQLISRVKIVPETRKEILTDLITTVTNFNADMYRMLPQPGFCQYCGPALQNDPLPQSYQERYIIMGIIRTYVHRWLPKWMVLEFLCMVLLRTLSHSLWWRTLLVYPSPSAWEFWCPSFRYRR